jgi:hypothetical protein
MLLSCHKSAGKNHDINVGNKTKLRGFSPQANYTDRATAACQRSSFYRNTWRDIAENITVQNHRHKNVKSSKNVTCFFKYGSVKHVLLECGLCHTESLSS